MRILIDLQGAQSGSRHRGIGRYSIALAKAIIRNRGAHDVFVLLNALFTDDLETIKQDLSTGLSPDRILVFHAPAPVHGDDEDNAWRREAAELIREWTITRIGPDWVIVTSLFEGATDNSVTSVGRLESAVAVAVVFYDLIPFIDPDKYLFHPTVKGWYYSKIDSLRRADLLLCISESSRHEAVDCLYFEAGRAITISSAADQRFRPVCIEDREREILLNRLGICRKFVMHASAFEPRKNFEGLVRAFALLPDSLRQTHQLVLIAAHATDNHEALRRIAAEVGLSNDDLVLLHYVSDDDLIALYSLCTLFVFPSFHEGFGLPALEAMCCGAAVIGSDKTSIPEIVGREDALFDPGSDRSIAETIRRALTDIAFWESLKAHSVKQSQRFSWDQCALHALRAIEETDVSHQPKGARQDASALLQKIAGIACAATPSQEDLLSVADCIALNQEACLLSENAEMAVSGKVRRADLEESNREVLPNPIIEVLRRDIWLPDHDPRILLLKLDHIGDFIITIDAFKLIRDAWPKGHITLVCGPWNKALAEQTGFFDDIVCCEILAPMSAEYDTQTAMARALRRFSYLALGRFDLAVDLRFYTDTRVLLSYIDAKFRAGYAAEGIELDLALPMLPHTHPDDEATVHNGARAIALAASVAWSFGVPAGQGREHLLGRRLPRRFFDEGVVIGVAPGTGNPIKSWGRGRFAELARRLHNIGGYKFVLIGGEQERADTKFIAEALPSSDCIDLAGKFQITDLPPVFAGLNLIIGNDTGTTHMAALMGIPTVCVFSGNSQVNSWRPTGPRTITLRRAVPCSPCFLTKLAECRYDHSCMDISPQRVLTEAINLLERAG